MPHFRSQNITLHIKHPYTYRPACYCAHAICAPPMAAPSVITLHGTYTNCPSQKTCDPTTAHHGPPSE